MMQNQPNPRYYTEDIIAKVSFWFALMASVLVMVWGNVYGEGMNLGMLQCVMLIMGKVLYPDAKLGRVEDNPLTEKSKRELRYTTGRGSFLLAVVLGVVFIIIIQTVLMATYSMSIDTGYQFFRTYGIISAGISESYLLHWGLQTNIAAYGNKWLAVIAVPIMAVFLHSMAYGAAGIGVVIIFAMFLIFSVLFELTRRLSVPIIVHLAINLMSLG